MTAEQSLNKWFSAKRTLDALDFLKRDLHQLDRLVRRSPTAHGLIHDALRLASQVEEGVERRIR